MSFKPSIAIIGAGMAGLSLARALGDRANVTIFEKSRGVAGRMATRKRDRFSFDHGAQYFTIRDERFRAALQPARSNEAVASWDIPFHRLKADRNLEPIIPPSPRYIGVPTMTALAKFWAAGCNVLLDRKVTGIAGAPGQWRVACENAEPEGPFDWVVSTAPAPQAALLLPFDEANAAAIRAVEMQACFTLTMSLPSSVELPFSACQVDHPVIGWIARNETKKGRGETPCLVVHADNGWASNNIDRSLEAVQADMLSALHSLLPATAFAEPDHLDLHRWRYASVSKPLGHPFLIDREQGIAACGDWCLGNRVEAAFLSGFILAEALAYHWSNA